MSIIRHNFNPEKLTDLVRANDGLSSREKMQLIELISTPDGESYDVDKKRSRSRYVAKLRLKGFVKQVRKHIDGLYSWTLEVFTSPTLSHSGLFYVNSLGNEAVINYNYVNKHSDNYQNDKKAHIEYLEILKNDGDIKLKLIEKYNLSTNELEQLIELKMIDDFEKNKNATAHTTYETYAEHFVNSRKQFIENYRNSANVITESRLRAEIALIRKAIQNADQIEPTDFRNAVISFLKKNEFGQKRGWIKAEEDADFVNRVRLADDKQGGIGKLYNYIIKRNNEHSPTPTVINESDTT